MADDKFGVVKAADPAEAKRLEAERKARVKEARERKARQSERAKAQAEQVRTGTPLARALDQALGGKKLKRG